MNQAVKITEQVSWIGILDYDIVSFDIVMKTDYGTTYNSYFIDAEKKTIIDTAKESFKDTYLDRINSVTRPEEIEYIVLNHTEPDHSGNLKHLLDLAPNAKVVGSSNAIRYLREIIDIPFESLVVKDNDELDLGNKTLRFISAPNLHWPDSIYTYLVEDQLLFTCDSFGCHYCDNAIFDDLTGDFDEAFNYYFNVILRPFSKFMLKAIEKIRPLPIGMICPGHGPILRSSWKKYLDRTEKMAEEYLKSQESDSPEVLIAYVSAYGYTREMALAVERGLKKAGKINTELADLEILSLGEMEERLTRNSALVIGSPTINQNTLLPVYKLFSVINPIRDKGKPAAGFGSYGWSGEAVNIIGQNLKNLKMKVFDEAAIFKFFPQAEKMDELEKFGQDFGHFILAEQKN